MKKILWMFIVLFLLGGAAAFAQEGGDNNTGGVADPYPWYYKVEVSVGFQMGFAMTDDTDWITRPTIVLGFRHYLRPVFRSLILGYSLFGTLSFPGEREWKSPDGQFIRIARGDLDSLLGFGGFLGGSLQGRMFGPIGLVLDAGLTGNVESGRGDYSWSSQYQGNNIGYNTYDLGLGLNGGMFVDFGSFSIELGANLGYSILRWDVYNLYASESSSNKLDTDGSTSASNIIRAAPYIMIGFKW